MNYGTDVIPLSHSATFNIKCLKWYLKDSPIRLDLACFQPKKNNNNVTPKQKNDFLGMYGSALFFFIDAVNSFLKNLYP